MPYANLTTISSAVNDFSRINTTGNGTWELNASLYSYNSTIYINNSDCSELRICGVDRNGRSLYGNTINDIYKIHDVKITGWNSSAGSTYERNGPVVYNTEVYNTQFEYLSDVSFHDNIIGTAYNISTNNCRGLKFNNTSNEVLHDIYIPKGKTGNAYNTSNALTISNSLNITVYNISVNDVSLEGIRVVDSTNGTFNNLSVIDAGDFPVYTTGSEGIVFNSGQNNTVSDIYINGTGGSALCPTAQENGTTFRNITVINAGHNGLDIHPAFNITVKNATFRDANAYNIMVTYGDGRSGYPSDILLKNVACYDSGSFMNVRCKNVTFDNVTYNGEGFSSKGNNNISIINSTTNTPVGYSTSNNYIDFERYTSTEGYVNESYDSYIIDCDTYGLYSFLSYNTRAINTKYSRFFACSDIGIYQYLDLVTVNSSGNRIPGTTLDLINEQNPNKTSCDRFGRNVTHFSTNNGRTYLPLENSTNSPAILESWYNGSLASKLDYTHTADIVTPQGNVTLTNITPASTWRRSAQNTPHYTITAIVNDSSATHLTGYTPSNDYNTYTEGDLIKFQVWTSEPVDFIQWEEGGITVASDTLTYETTVKDDPIVVNLFAEDANGSFSKEWIVESTVDLPNSNFTASVTNGTYPLIVAFTDLTTENATYWEWDFDNDGVVDSTTQNSTCKYKKPGNYTVKLTAGNALGEISDTKIKYITVTGTAPNKIPTHSMFGYIYNIFYKLFTNGWLWLS